MPERSGRAAFSFSQGAEAQKSRRAGNLWYRRAMRILNGLSLPDLSRLSNRPLARLRWVVRRHGLKPACRVGGIGIFGISDAVKIVGLASSVRAYKERLRRGKA